MTEKEALKLFDTHNALLEGHFRLSSGLHSGKYLQCARVLQHPDIAEELGEAIAAKFKKARISVVAGPAMGGIIIAHEVARALKARCVFGEREDGNMKLRRGFDVGPKDRVLVVEDVVTTGGSVKELADYIKGAKAKVVGTASIIDRSPAGLDIGYKNECLAKISIETFKPESCPLCKSRVPITKPGSRKIV